MKTWTKLFSLAVLLVCFCSLAAAKENIIAPDYQRTFGGLKATVELNDSRVVCAVARLMPLPGTDKVALPKTIKKYDLYDAGGEEAYLFVPHYKHTKFMVRSVAKTADNKLVPGGKILAKESEEPFIIFVKAGQSPTVLVNIMLQSKDMTRVVDYAPVGYAGGVSIPADQSAFLVDVSTGLPKDGMQVKRKGNHNALTYFKQL